MAAPGPGPRSFPVTSYLPFRWIYRLFKVASVLARLPVWLLKAAVPRLRPHPNWTLKQALMRNVLNHLLDMESRVGITAPLSLAPGREGPRWVTIEPLDADTLYVGPLVSAQVRPATTGGTWYGVERAPTSAQGLGRVALHVHGGAFVIGDGRTAATRVAGDALVRAAGFDAVLAPQYRLAGYGGRDPFPAALQDCLTSYLYLVHTLGVPAAAVTLVGDSAGGNLVLALLRYLERFGPQLGVPRPGHVVLVSPWVAPSAALRERYAAWARYRTDFIPPAMLRWGAEAYVEQAGPDAAASEYVNALGHPFRHTVPVLVTWGAEEVLGVDCARWADEMRAVPDQGARLEINVEADAPHDTLMVGDFGGWGASAAGVARRIKRFVDGNDGDGAE